MSIEGCPHGPKALWPEGGCTFCAQEDAREQAKLGELKPRLEALVSRYDVLAASRGENPWSEDQTTLKVYVVTRDDWDYDEYDEWCVLASSQDEAMALVLAHQTCPDNATLEIVHTAPVQAGVAYASFHPG